MKLLPPCVFHWAQRTSAPPTQSLYMDMRGWPPLLWGGGGGGGIPVSCLASGVCGLPCRRFSGTGNRTRDLLLIGHLLYH